VECYFYVVVVVIVLGCFGYVYVGLLWMLFDIFVMFWVLLFIGLKVFMVMMMLIVVSRL